jgi:HD-GYP domain-containing protein (c-di-GMP phosphodiesterase class II)
VSHFTQDFRISVGGLATGMYVSRLDRPWLGTSFPLEGFLVKSDEDIAQVQRLCHFVYVDITRGKSPDPRFVELGHSDLLERARSHDAIADLLKTRWELKTSFEAELPQAEGARKSLELGIKEVMHDLQSGRDLDLHKLRDGVEAMIDSVTRNPAAFIWLKAIKRKDNYAYQHSLGCSVWAASFGRHLGMSRPELSELALSGLLFDVGKTRVPSDLLAKKTAFDEFDHLQMRAHVQHGIDILDVKPQLPPRVIEAVATHHERHDGSGYPNGLRGSEIPIFGRIIGLIDSYDAMTSTRPYAASHSPHHTVMELYQSRDVLFQTELVEQFIQTCGIYPTGSLVELSDGRVGVVTAVHSLKRLRPSVMVLLDEQKNPLSEFRSIDLSWVREDSGGDSLTIKRGLPQGAFGIDPADLFLD